MEADIEASTHRDNEAVVDNAHENESEIPETNQENIEQQNIVVDNEEANDNAQQIRNFSNLQDQHEGNADVEIVNVDSAKEDNENTTINENVEQDITNEANNTSAVGMTPVAEEPPVGNETQDKEDGGSNVEQDIANKSNDASGVDGGSNVEQDIANKSNDASAVDVSSGTEQAPVGDESQPTTDATPGVEQSTNSNVNEPSKDDEQIPDANLKSKSPDIVKEKDSETFKKTEDTQTPVQITVDHFVGLEDSHQEQQTHSNITVKCVLEPSKEVLTFVFSINKDISSLKMMLADAMKIPSSAIEIRYKDQGIDDASTAESLGCPPNGTIEFNLFSKDVDSNPLKSVTIGQPLLEIIKVTIKDTDGKPKDITVELERANIKKPYLGGFKNKHNGIEYHNASAQTYTKIRPWDGKTRFCRDTQTVYEGRKTQQTTSDTSTQMTGIGVYVSNATDKLIEPGLYETAAQFHKKRLNAVIIVQTYYRRWAAKRLVQSLREDREQRLQFDRDEEFRKRKEKEDRIRIEFERRMNPKTQQDFDLLYHALEKWRIDETNEINSKLTGAARKAALCMLLEQETNLISAINQHKIEANKQNKIISDNAFLSKTAAPKKWRSQDGNMIEMQTPYTIRARQLKEIYQTLNMKFLTQDERLDILLTLKHSIMEHDCKLTADIAELIDREADLLMRGVKEENLMGLRKRISTLFLQYCKTPTFNPEAARHLPVPQDPSILRKGIHYCSSCNSYLPSSEFPLSSNSHIPGKCRKCRSLDNDARARQDYSHYVYMLRNLRLEEESIGDNSRIALLLQEQDLQYLVENIWGGQSALSQWSDLYDLTLIRWNKYKEWSPWNCILLTKDETTAHDRIENLEEAYGIVFLNKVKQKHTLARNYFSRLAGMAEQIRKIQPTRQKRVLSKTQAELRNTLIQFNSVA